MTTATATATIIGLTADGRHVWADVTPDSLSGIRIGAADALYDGGALRGMIASGEAVLLDEYAIRYRAYLSGVRPHSYVALRAERAAGRGARQGAAPDWGAKDRAVEYDHTYYPTSTPKYGKAGDDGGDDRGMPQSVSDKEALANMRSVLGLD